MPAGAGQPQLSQNHRFLLVDGSPGSAKLIANLRVGQPVSGQVQNVALVGFQRVPAGGRLRGV